MQILIINFFLCLLYGIIAWVINRSFKGKGTLIFLALTFIQLLILYTFANPDSMCDLPSYKDAFDNASSYKLTIDSITEDWMEPGYIILNKIIHSFSKDFAVFLGVYGFVLLACLWKTIIKYSPYNIISVICFVIIFFNGSLFILRQNLAVALCVFAFQFVIKRDFKRFILLVIIAFLLHRSALIFLPVYFIYPMKKVKGYVLLSSIVLVLSVFATTFIHNILNQSFKYSSYTDSMVTFTNVAIAGIILFFYIFFLKKDALKDGINRLILGCLCIAFVGFIALASGIGTSTRLLQYFTVANIFAIPLTTKYIKLKSIKFIYVIGVLFFYFLLAFVVNAGESCIKDFNLIF